jgi:hypothetical protein
MSTPILFRCNWSTDLPIGNGLDFERQDRPSAGHRFVYTHGVWIVRRNPFLTSISDVIINSKMNFFRSNSFSVPWESQTHLNYLVRVKLTNYEPYGTRLTILLTRHDTNSDHDINLYPCFSLEATSDHGLR